MYLPRTGKTGPSQQHLLSKVTKGSIPFFRKYSTVTLYESPTYQIRKSAGILQLTTGLKKKVNLYQQLQEQKSKSVATPHTFPVNSQAFGFRTADQCDYLGHHIPWLHF